MFGWFGKKEVLVKEVDYIDQFLKNIPNFNGRYNNRYVYTLIPTTSESLGLEATVERINNTFVVRCQLTDGVHFIIPNGFSTMIETLNVENVPQCLEYFLNQKR